MLTKAISRLQVEGSPWFAFLNAGFVTALSSFQEFGWLTYHLTGGDSMTLARSVPSRSRRQPNLPQHRANGLRTFRRLALLISFLAFGGYDAAQAETSASPVVAKTATIQKEETPMWLTVGGSRFAVSLADTEAAHQLASMLPFTMRMADLNSNEKHGELSKSISTKAVRPGVIHEGDLLLYGSSTLVLFYKTFDSAYSYTSIGRVNDPTGLAQALGSGDVKLTFSKD